MTEIEYEPGPCPQCGAATADEAGTRCTATQEIDGDYHCAGTDCREDDAGRLLFPTQASLDRLEAWYHEQGMADQAAEEASERVFEALQKFFGTTIHGWPCIPARRTWWWRRRDRREAARADAALAAIGRGPFTPEMSRVYWEQLRIGQDFREDAGGWYWRCWCAALGLPFRPATCTYSGYVGPDVKPVHIGIDPGAGDDMTIYAPAARK